MTAREDWTPNVERIADIRATHGTPEHPDGVRIERMEYTDRTFWTIRAHEGGGHAITIDLNLAGWKALAASAAAVARRIEAEGE